MRIKWHLKFAFEKGIKAFTCGTSGQELRYQTRDFRDSGLIPGSGRSPREGNGNSLQYSCLENPMDQGVVGYGPLSQGVGHD